MKKFIFAVVASFALSMFAQAGEKSQSPAKGQAAAPAPVKTQNAAPAKGEVKKTEVLVPMSNREKRQLDLYKKVEIVVSTPCCETCDTCRTTSAKGGLFSRLRAKRTATVCVCENCSK